MPSLVYKPYYGTFSVSTNGLETGESSNSSSAYQNLDVRAVDEISAMLDLERTHYPPCNDSLPPHHDHWKKGYATHLSRHQICEWAYSVVDHFTLDRQVVSIAMYYVDRMASFAKHQPLENNVYRLLGISSLYLAIKLHGETDDYTAQAPRKLELETFVELSRGYVTTEEIESMERKILRHSKWHVNPPTMVVFISTLLRFLPDSWGNEPTDICVAPQIFEMARYLTELAVCMPSVISQYKASEIAFAAILCSLDGLRSKMHFPYEARLAFQDAVQAATSMSPRTKGVRFVCFELKKLESFPYKYEDLNIPMPTGGLTRSGSSMGSEGGTASPVCVLEPFNNKVQNQKCTRLIYE